jgi:hypothetical protein
MKGIASNRSRIEMASMRGDQGNDLSLDVWQRCVANVAVYGFGKLAGIGRIPAPGQW